MVENLLPENSFYYYFYRRLQPAKIQIFTLVNTIKIIRLSMKKIYFFTLFLLSSIAIIGQNTSSIIQQHLRENMEELKLSESDINEWRITDQHTSRQSGATYVYIQQQSQGINVFNGVANFAIKNGKVVSMGNRLISQLDNKTNYNTPAIDPVQAITVAAGHLNLEAPKDIRPIEANSSREYLFNKGGISLENIPVELMYQAISDTEVKLVWNLSIYTLDANNWWSVRIDAQTGELVHKNDWVTHCQVDHTVFTNCNHDHRNNIAENEATFMPESYNVFPLPVESPVHGERMIVTNPADAIASPYGWHDTDGVAGAEYTITRGNNVYAYEDASDTNSPGFSPDGGASLEFDFPYIANGDPVEYRPAAITNLFYLNNMMHDIWHRYGFDEASGNFQMSNYGHGGQGDDYVLAEAQDGSGTNNANFATPPDGFNPRMQMFLWYGGLGDYLTIESPTGIAGSYASTSAGFGPGLPSTPITAEVVLMEDDTDPVNNGCETIVNGAALAGKIALVDRGDCNFTVKVFSAQNQGALAVIVVNNVNGNPISMGGTNNQITIPSIMIFKSDGDLIKAELENGPVTASISNGGAGAAIQDSDFDNGIIAHEYTHGISNRLTGGGNNADCLFNSEQMGEGWSDWYGLVLTIEPGDQGSDVRGMGTFANGESPDGNGIRPAPYSTNFDINPYTYGDSNNAGAISEPHGVGFIFATALWDMTWALIDEYGGTPDPDLYQGTGGNNIAMQLVTEAMKIQPCNPGMIDGRDAILAADELLYDGAHQCLIWEVFAKRGFGYSANQGSAFSRSDQVEAFDEPPICQVATEAPVAAFSALSDNACSSEIRFANESTGIVHTYEWVFGDGNTSDQVTPLNNFPGSGTYTIQLIVSNNIGSDTTSQSITIELPPAPEIEDLEVCLGENAILEANTTGLAQWRDADNNVIFNGPSFETPNVNGPQTYFIENLEGGPSGYVGPEDPGYAGGSYHVSGYHGALNFTAEMGLEIVSVWVNAQGAGERTFTIGSGFNNDGDPPSGANIVDQVTVYLNGGPQRIYLNMTVPEAGDYNIGGNNVSLYRNNEATDYPFVLDDYMTIVNSSANTAPTGYYYYFYDIEVREIQCISPAVEVNVTPVVSDFSFIDEGDLTVNFTDESTGATSWLWDFGDGNTSTEQSPVHTYEYVDNYTVTLTINDGACSSSQVFTTVTSVDDAAPAGLGISLFPNPADGWARVVFDNAITEDLQIQLIDISGKTLSSYLLRAGQQFADLEVAELPAAVYLVRIQGQGFTEMRKLVIKR
jgi:PKD repeat protein